MRPRHASQWLADRARRTPDAEALRCGPERQSFAALEREVRRRATRLRSDGVRPGHRVAATLTADFAGVWSFWAVLCAGAELAPLNPRWAAAERKRNLEVLRADHELEGPIEPLDESPAPETPDGFRPEATAWVLFTSGTGGRPKPARLQHRHLEASALASARHLGSRIDDRWLACLPLFHVGGLMILVRGVIDGAGVCLQSGFDAPAVDRALDEEGITHVSLVPTTLKRLLDHRGERPAPASLRAVLLGGAASPPGLVSRARAAGFPVRPTYGLTEAASQVATAAADDLGPGLVGAPLPGYEVRIVDEKGAAQEAGALGTVEVRGPSVFEGYDRDPAQTQRVLRDGWLHTGDRGRLDEWGRLWVLERVGDLIVSGGENVHPAEVEATLLDHPEVDEVAVAGVPDEDLGRRVVAWVVPRAGARGDLPQRLEAHARELLAGPMIPREVRLVAALPRNAMGKVVRRELVRLRAAPRQGAR